MTNEFFESIKRGLLDAVDYTNGNTEGMKIHTRKFDNTPLNWTTTTIGQITQKIEAIDPKTRPDEAFYYLDISSIDNALFCVQGAKFYSGKNAPSRARQLVKQGDTLFSTVRIYLKNIALVPKEYDNQVASTGFSILRPEEGVDHNFIYYLCLTNGFLNRLKPLQRGTSYPAIRDQDIRVQTISLPPTKEQHRIVAKIEELFSELDQGIESLKAAQAQLKTYRQAILKHAFEGKLTEAWREKHGDKVESGEVLIKRIKTAREKKYQIQLTGWQEAVKQWKSKGKHSSEKPKKPSKPKIAPPFSEDDIVDLPDLPNGWSWIRYGDLCALIRNGTSKVPSENGADKIFRISAVRPMALDLNDFRRIVNTKGELDEFLLKPNDLIFTRYNGSPHYVGVCARFSDPKKFFYPDKLIRTVLSNEEYLNTSYIEKAVNSGASREFIRKRIRTTAGQAGISGGDIIEMPVPICSKLEQDKIAAELDSTLSQIDQLEKTITESLQKANTLRQSILHKAFTGQLVPQDPTDEPASVLLERIRAEREAAAAPAPRNNTGKRRGRPARRPPEDQLDLL